VGVDKVTPISRMRISRSMLEESSSMLCLILIVGGLLTMMEQHDRSEALFHYFRRLRRLKLVREQFFLAAVAQNIKRLVRFFRQPTTPVLPATT
jgi:hypothetical protein